MTEVDTTIGQVDRLYRELVGAGYANGIEKAYAHIPPEKDPKKHVEAQIDKLTTMLSQTDVKQALLSWRGRPFQWTPALSVWETSDAYYVSFDLPGLNKDQIEITIEGASLLVSGERLEREVSQGVQQQARWLERPMGAFQRMIPLPSGVNAEGMEANLQDGVLQVKLPKATNVAAEKRKISIS